jgi:hypothetical protein
VRGRERERERKKKKNGSLRSFFFFNHWMLLSLLLLFLLFTLSRAQFSIEILPATTAGSGKPTYSWYFLNSTSNTLLLRSEPPQPDLPSVNTHLRATRAVAGNVDRWTVASRSIKVDDGRGAVLARGEGNFDALMANKDARIQLGDGFLNAEVSINLTIGTVIPSFQSPLPLPSASTSAAPTKRPAPSAQPVYTDGEEGPVSLPLIFSIAALIACLIVTAGILYQRHRANQRAIAYNDLRRDGL